MQRPHLLVVGVVIALVGIRAVGHEGSIISNRLRTERRVEVSAPGTYEISFEGDGTDGFDQVTFRRVSVRAGETAELLVELRRK